MKKAVTLEEVLNLANQLSAVDKLSLIEQIAPQIKRELHGVSPPQPQSLRGLWRSLDITEQDIAEARQQMWGNFPRQDV
ncbi:MAG TPA: hypothetical protein IGS52_00685 [Oscillatoriaceae cyanobacterium M33_DOE_052]|uniref:DUF2281 domain-containing protein n=1 Tax=Planktothricoides sp. SpSt-374 TaxID=2282167 RepID=A0A7C3VQI0_9CYAN|nr:hypothetical protein [Oscillatoriaceae cyanobacterium M33_DOE_052]